MTTEMTIEKHVEGPRGRYVVRNDGVDGEAELAFTVHNPREISADHSEAPASMRGRGAAAALVEHTIVNARASGFKIVPLCPYVLAQCGSHPEWSDIIGSGGST